MDEALVDGQAVRRVQRGRQHVREERGEQRRHGQRDRRRGAGERPALPADPVGDQPADQARAAASDGEHTAAGGGRAAASVHAEEQPPPARRRPGPARAGQRRWPGRRMSPVVLSARKIAPWVTNSASVVRPPSSAYGLSRSSRPPTYSWSASSGTPRTMLANATPHRTAGTSEPNDDAPVPAAPARPRSGRLPRYSKATPRTISATQDQQQRQVEAGEQGGVPLGEGGEHRAAGGDQPDLVAVPDRADGVDQDAALAVVAAEHGQQHADAEVEALQDEVADEQHGDEQEPDGRAVPWRTPVLVREGQRPVRRRPRSRRRPG